MAAGAAGAYLITGANKGIGFALVRHILEKGEESGVVFLGSRDGERGRAAKASLPAELQERVEVVELDVTSDASVAHAVEQVQQVLAARQQHLSALINNAGVYFGEGKPSLRQVLEVNVWGLKRVSDAFFPLLLSSASSATKSRVVNVTSAAGPMGVAAMSSEERKRVFVKPNSWQEVEEALAEALAIDEKAEGYDAEGEKAEAYERAGFGAKQKDYYLSKAAANALTLLQARLHPSLIINALTPGYVETDMTRGFIAEGKSGKDVGMKQPWEAMAPFDVALWADVPSGRYYGSDGKRSPLDRYRSPGDPEYTSDAE